MFGDGGWWRRSGLLVAATLSLGACAGELFHSGARRGGEGGLNAYPANYKADIVAAMHAYLNDPTGIRSAAISAPMLTPIGNETRYVVCLQYDGKKDNGAYAGVKEIAAVFLAGRFDDFADAAATKEPCAGAALAPFPELERLQR